MRDNENRNTEHFNTTRQTIIQESKINVELIKKIKDWKADYHLSGTNTRKNVKVETKKIDELIRNITKDTFTELNELIYIGAKLVCWGSSENLYPAVVKVDSRKKLFLTTQRFV